MAPLLAPSKGLSYDGLHGQKRLANPAGVAVEQDWVVCAAPAKLHNL